VNLIEARTKKNALISLISLLFSFQSHEVNVRGREERHKINPRKQHCDCAFSMKREVNHEFLLYIFNKPRSLQDSSCLPTATPWNREISPSHEERVP